MTKTKINIPELLAPAGSFEKLVTAIHYGADAIYLGGEKYSLRARAANFDEPGLRQAVHYAHKRGVKIYVTINIFARGADLAGLEDYLRLLADIGVDALIISDPGILLIAGRVAPDIPVHLSTQANVTNAASVAFWASQGVKRVNLARELGLEEIRAIRAATDLELEVFVHGALCISYSGRCLLSTYFTGRDANQGDCAHPCRYSYSLVEEKRPGQYFPVEEDERGTYIFNSRDLCLLKRLPQLLSAGVDSVKIEGRVKSMGYVGQVVRLYRAALDWLQAQNATGAKVEKCELPDAFTEELLKVGTRGQTENFFHGHQPTPDDMLYKEMRTPQTWAPVGVVRRGAPLLIETRNVLEIGDEVEYLGQGMITRKVRVAAMTGQGGAPLRRANPGNKILLRTEPLLTGAEEDALLRKNMNT